MRGIGRLFIVTCKAREVSANYRRGRLFDTDNSHRRRIQTRFPEQRDSSLGHKCASGDGSGCSLGVYGLSTWLCLCCVAFSHQPASQQARVPAWRGHFLTGFLRLVRDTDPVHIDVGGGMSCRSMGIRVCNG